MCELYVTELPKSAVTDKAQAPAGPPSLLIRLAARSAFALCSIVLLAALLYLPGIGARDFWAPDEPRFAQVGREMLRSGDFVLPRFNGEPLALLPPWTYWLVAIASYPRGGVSETSARILVAVFAALALVVTFLLGRRMFGGPAGLAGSAVLATAALFFHQARWLQADMFLTMAVTAAIALLYRALESARGSWIFFAAAGLASGVGILAKGPLGIVIPALVVFAFAALNRDWRLLVHPGVYLALAVSLSVALPWYLLAYRVGGLDFTRVLVMKHNLGMFYDSWTHKQPVYYHAVNILWGFAPWTPFLPGAIAHAFRSGVDGQSVQARGSRFLLAWAAILFLFFSACSAKQSKYLLPAYPALAILVGRFLSDAARGALRVNERWLAVPMDLSSAALALAGLAVPAVAWTVERSLTAAALVAAGTLLAASITGLLLLRAQRAAAAAWTWIPAAVMLAALAGWIVLPSINKHKSYRGFANVAAQFAGDGGRIGVYGIGRLEAGGIIYYADRKITVFSNKSEDEGQLPSGDDQSTILRDAAAFLLGQQRTVLVATKDSLSSLEQACGARLPVLGEARVGHRQLVLVGKNLSMVSGGAR